MAAIALRRDEASALAVAAVLHAALIGVLLLQRDDRAPAPEPERVVVSLSEEVGLNSTSPDPVAVSRAAEAPVFSELTAPPPPSVAQVTPPQTEPQAAPPRPAPAPSARPRPARTSTPRPQPTRAARPAPAPSRASRPAPTPAPAAPVNSGASRIGSDFLPGAGTSTTSSETRVPASQIGASTQASLLSQIVREVRPKFDPPSGVDVEKLVSVVRFRLNADGSLDGRPSMIRQSGVTDANSAQAGRHGELAVRAVVLAAPFDLPSQYHEAFKTVTLNFDASL